MFYLKIIIIISKKFYTPKYRSFADPAFERYGIIHWDPELKIEQNEKVK
jgi:hypothetical protein